MKLKLQYFANSDVAQEVTTKEQETEATSQVDLQDEAEATSKKKYTDEDIDRIINDKFQKWQTKKAKEIDEAKKLAEMNEKQRAEYERDTLQAQLDELTKKNTFNELSKEARSMLLEGDISLSDSLVAMLVSENAEKTKAQVEEFIKLFNAEVEKAVTRKVKGSTPKSGKAVKEEDPFRQGFNLI